MNVRVYMKDDSRKEYLHPRDEKFYPESVYYKGSFFIIRLSSRREIVFPAHEIKSIETWLNQDGI